MIEFDTPAKLLKMENGALAEMVKKQGDAFYEEMLKIAVAHSAEVNKC